MNDKEQAIGFGAEFSLFPLRDSLAVELGVVEKCDHLRGDGNVLNDSVHTYTWDAYGRAITMDGIGLTYDAFGRMVEQNRSGAYTQFMYSPTGFKMTIFNGQTVTKNFVPLPGGGTAVYTPNGLLDVRHPDWLGSSRFSSTPSRTMYLDTAYAPFGEPYAQSGTTDLSFTGQNSDTTSGVYDFLYRPYSTQGRWATPDPAGLAAVDPTNPQSWNRYAYVLNNPLRAVDLLGLMCYATFEDDDGDDYLDQIPGVDQETCESGDNATWIPDVNTTVIVNGNDSGGNDGSGLPPAGCAFFYQDGELLGTGCGNQFTPPSGPAPTSEQYIQAIAQAAPTVCGGGLFFYAGVQGKKRTTGDRRFRRLP